MRTSGLAGAREVGSRARVQRDQKQDTLKGSGLKPKDLMMMPARVAMALRDDGAADVQAMRTIERIGYELADEYRAADEEMPDPARRVLDRLAKEYAQAKGDSWWLRSEIIWHKPNPMPESVTDRPTSAHEKIFLLSKSARYFYDSEAVSLSRDGQGQSEVRASRSQAPHADGRINTNGGRMEGDSGQPRKQMPLLWGDGEVDDGPCDSSQQGRGARQGKHRSGMQELQRQEGQQTSGPNLRNVWKISTHSFSEAHFATFPPALVEPCIKAWHIRARRLRGMRCAVGTKCRAAGHWHHDKEARRMGHG